MFSKWILTTILILLAASGFAMQIQIEIVGGGTFTLEVETTDSIDQVKLDIQTAEGISPEDQTLMFGGRDLEDGRTLADYNIEEGDALQLNVAGSVTDPGTGTDPDDPGDDVDPGGDPGDDSDPGDGTDPGDDNPDTDNPEDPGTDLNDDGEGQPVYTTQNGPVDRDEPGSTSSTTAPATAPATVKSSPEYVDRLEAGVQSFVREIQAQEQAGE